MTSLWDRASNVSFKPEAWSGKFDLGKSLGGGVAFPWMAAATVGSSLIGGLFGSSAARTQANIAQAQLNAASDQLRNQILEGRNMAKFQEAGNIGARVAQGTWMPDVEFGRQREAALFSAGPLGEKQLALNMQDARQRFGLEGSAEARAATQRANRERLKESLAQREGAMAGMFGRIAPRDVTTMFI